VEKNVQRLKHAPRAGKREEVNQCTQRWGEIRNEHPRGQQPLGGVRYTTCF